MCIVSLAWQAHPRWKLVIIGNRDEMHDRPSEPLARWDDPDHLIAGRDIKAGGTWLGVSEQGRCAVVTNLAGFGFPDPSLASRGDLLKDYLCGSGQYADLDISDFGSFNPFNLITITGEEARIHSNHPHAMSETLSPGIHGLSNGTLAAPWPKSAALNDALEKWLDGDADTHSVLLDRLNDRAPRRNMSGAAETGKFAPKPEHSPIFIDNPVYGTRCSTVVTIDHKNQGTIAERSYSNSGEQSGETNLVFDWPR